MNSRLNKFYPVYLVPAMSDIAIMSGVIFIAFINSLSLSKFFIKLLIFTCNTVNSLLSTCCIKSLALLYKDNISGGDDFKKCCKF